MDNLKPSVDGSEADNDRVADNDSYEHTYRVMGGVLQKVTRKRKRQKHRNEEELEAVDVGGDNGAVDGSRAEGDIEAVDCSEKEGNVEAVDGSDVGGDSFSVDGSETGGNIDVVDGSDVWGDSFSVDDSDIGGDSGAVDGSEAEGNIEAVDGSDVGGDSFSVDDSDVGGDSFSFDVCETEGVGTSSINMYGLAFDEIREKELHNETDDDRIQHRRPAVCDKCLLFRVSSISAICMCNVCDKFLCVICMFAHDYKHSITEISSESETDMQVSELVDTLMDEENGEEEFNRENVSVTDRVCVKHKLDKYGCDITGMCSLGYLTWVSCDTNNCCIKLFSVGPNLLQRYIRFVCRPFDVTEINDEHNESIATLSDSLSEPSTKPKRQCLLAVSFPLKRFIMFVDLSKRPAVKSKIIQTNTPCYTIQCHNNRLYVGCSAVLSTSRLSVMTLDGEVLHTINTNVKAWSSLRIVVGKDSIFSPNYYGKGVVSFDHKGLYKSSIAMEGSSPHAISLDSENDRMYVVTGSDTIYRLNTDLTYCEKVLDFDNVMYVGCSDVVCFHKDKLYIGHNRVGNYITVVRVL